MDDGISHGWERRIDARITYRDQGAAAPGGWAYDYGKGRVCYMSPGHMLVDLWNPEYIKLQHNAVRWLMRQSS